MFSNLINSGRPLFGKLPNGVYDIVPYLKPGLMVDCGAAVGGVTSKLRMLSPASRVIAFEPFPGNHAHFEHRHARDPQVTLYKAAVGAKRGKASFFTPSTVRSPARMKSTPGASFVGRLDQSRAPDGEKVIEVDVYPLDEICREPVRFLKIDVQGGESDAIDGAARLIANREIDVIYIELMRNPDLLKKMGDLGFIMFDCEYVLTPKAGGDQSGWFKISDTVLSTGSASIRGWPENAPNRIGDYNRWVESETEKAGYFSTDLVAIRESFLPDLFEALAQAIRAEDARRAARG